jgi:hypothetical protein
MTSGASAYDTSALPWRGACLRRSRPAARAQRTLRRVIVGERAAGTAEGEASNLA